MKQRIITGVIIALVLAGFLALRQIDNLFFDFFVLILSTIAAFEYAKMFDAKQKPVIRIASIIFPSMLFSLLIALIRTNQPLYIIGLSAVILLLGTFFLIFIILLCFNKKIYSKMLQYNAGRDKIEFVSEMCINTLKTFIYPTFILAFLYVINNFAVFGKDISNILSFSNTDIGLLLLLMLIFSTCASDIFALFIGKAFGKRKLAPKISPNKTIAGAIGGIVGSVVVLIAMYYTFNAISTIAIAFTTLKIGVLYFILYGIWAAIFSIIGDLFESYLKRKAGVKDSGGLLKGHGGVMDRLDSISFNALFTFVYWLLIIILI